jgi:hypothetical protein
VGQKLHQTRKNGALDSPKISKIVGSMKLIFAVQSEIDLAIVGLKVKISFKLNL